jgi:hypothetical protein
LCFVQLGVYGYTTIDRKLSVSFAVRFRAPLPVAYATLCFKNLCIKKILTYFH